MMARSSRSAGCYSSRLIRADRASGRETTIWSQQFRHRDQAKNSAHDLDCNADARPHCFRPLGATRDDGQHEEGHASRAAPLEASPVGLCVTSVYQTTVDSRRTKININIGASISGQRLLAQLMGADCEGQCK